MTGRLFQLTPSQLDARERGDTVRLTRLQTTALRRRGLVTAANQWHYGSTGSFALAPRDPASWSDTGRRKRVTLQPVTTAPENAA